MTFADRDASGIGSLADPVGAGCTSSCARRPAPVSREQAAIAADIPLHQAKFHLDKLEGEGLLDTDYARLHGRTGPGAGRTSKLYRRAARDIAVSLPTASTNWREADGGRDRGISRRGTPVINALHRVPTLTAGRSPIRGRGRRHLPRAAAFGWPPRPRQTTGTNLGARTLASSWPIAHFTRWPKRIPNWSAG